MTLEEALEHASCLFLRMLGEDNDDTSQSSCKIKPNGSVKQHSLCSESVGISLISLIGCIDV